jgi:hypothetical protein
MSDLTAKLYLLFVDDVDRVAVLNILRAIHEDAEFREACLKLGHLSGDIPEDLRLERAVLTLEMFLSSISPGDDEATLTHAFAPNFLAGQKRFFAWKWRKHVALDASSGLLTNYLAQRVRAIEALWRVDGKILGAQIPVKFTTSFVKTSAAWTPPV